ncbi:MULTISPECIES: hypothetical protein [Streptomyces]|uniref:hypothetical protein n=1 Tax=Streptomyces TaxID=1883 RepID=UPI0004CB2038|nr:MULTISPECIES: hypothetical protein [Streptomyces]MDX2920192.1 hypothetical protein [Streptomyces sp. NE06-03C]MDX3608522.1 hypothetical protein [Streptomyces sp. FL06-04B]MDX3734550.1 hypothetical protein [Streptomyces sp. ID01-15D]
MPTPERAARPTPSDLSMKDLLASCAAATAVSTPPSDTADAPEASDAAAGNGGRSHADAVRRHAA